MSTKERSRARQGMSPEDADRFDTVAEELPRMKRDGVEAVWDKVMALWNLLCDPTAGWSERAMALVALFYLVTPIDVIPDFLPGGLTDDVAFILATVAAIALRVSRFLTRYAAQRG
ncbi:MAG: DUF1232 domain-containing protein [Candidatus Riflebacteria bacterium]|nr:DUF1232 domain-containing protein [Candidatus Riflebacteria bacterium]